MEEIDKSSILKALGKNIKQIRLLKGLSQENLASELQKSVNFVSLVERGESGISISTIVDICNALNVEPNALFFNIVETPDVETDSFIINSLKLFEKKDKEIIKNLITYILNSKK